jgi:hypothetical protein
MRDIGIEGYLNIVTNLIPVFAGWESVRKMDFAVRTFWWYMLIAFVVIVIASVVYIAGYTNIYIYHFFNFFEAAYLFWLIQKWTLNKSIHKIIPVLQFLNLVSFGYLLIYKNQLMLNVSDYNNLRNVALLPLRAWLTMEIGLNSKVDLLKNYKFWFIFASFFNLAMLAIHFAMNLWVLPNNQYALKYTIHILFAANIIAYILIGKGFLCYRHQLNSSGFSQSPR